MRAKNTGRLWRLKKEDPKGKIKNPTSKTWDFFFFFLLFSFILWGPPGSGKTTLARIYAKALNAEFHELSAVDSGKDDIKNILGKKGSLPMGKPKVLFIDEIHRFNKAQQDFLLPYVERGDLTLIGATTENPSFEIISALLSRCRVFVLNELSDADMEQIIKQTKIKVNKESKEWLIQMAQGDARQDNG